MKHKVLLFFGVALIFLTNTASTQALSGVSSRLNDSFVAWDLYQWLPMENDSTQLDEYKYGRLQQRWMNVREDWTEWDFDLGDLQGTIKMKWKNDPSEWELRTFTGEVVTMKTIWKGDYANWRITNNDISFDFKSRYSSQFGEWAVTSSSHGNFSLEVEQENDPRDWEATDELDETVPEVLKLAMVFVAIFHASPKM